MIIVGSTALKLHKIPRQEPVDFDVLVPIGTRIEGYDCIPVPHELLHEVTYFYYHHYNVELQRNESWKVATLDSLLTIKCSHFHLDLAWDKTKQDILWLISKGAVIIPDLFQSLKTYWDQDKGRKIEVSLKMTAEEFFSGSDFPYEHDQLHNWAAGNNSPIYTKCLSDGEQVLISRFLFDKMDFADQIQMIKEEIAVIACERWLVHPKSKVRCKVHAWQFALKKVITTLMKGYFSAFVVKNLVHFIQVDHKLLNNILINTTYGEDTMSDLQQEFIDLLKKYKEETGEGDYYIVREGHGSLPEGVRHIEQEGGESDGEYAYTVWTYKGEFFRLDYNYYSHSGYENIDLDEIKQVKKVERTVAFYE